MPDFDVLINGDDQLDEKRWKLALWSLNLNGKFATLLDDVPRKHVITLLALMFLCKVRDLAIGSFEPDNMHTFVAE